MFVFNTVLLAVQALQTHKMFDGLAKGAVETSRVSTARPRPHCQLGNNRNT